jgi:two-component system NtrC family sensor kinase
MNSSLLRTSFLFFTLSLLIISNGVAQVASEVIHVKELPPEGFLLDKGWKFKIGDSPEYVAADYDDSGWESIDPTLDIHDSLPEIPEGKVCWLRIHLSIDSTISQLVMMIDQSVASEIYLNGKMIHRLGVLDVNSNEIKAINPKGRPFAFPFEKKKEQTLSIRFSKQPGIGYGTHWASDNPAIRISLNTVEAGQSYYKLKNANIDTNNFLIGVFFILTILYLAFYVFYPAQKANLLFSLYAFLMTIGWATFRLYLEIDVIEWYPYTKNLFLIVVTTGSTIMLAAIYSLLKLRKDWLFYSVIAFAILCIPIGVFFYDWGWQVYGFVFTNTFHIMVGWIVFRSFRTNTKAAWIIAIGVICFEALWFGFTSGMITLYTNYFFALAQLSMPLAVSVYLGYDFALTNRSLKQKLDEVHRLSEEKQEILTNQNETLEKQVTERTAALKKSMDDLKSTQTQLIQSEKMASLGELTAGIAHEIQNPLNFVNNFAEVNKELIAEMDEAIRNGKLEEVKGIAKNIADNHEKINQHGKRADAIVKNMLQHSRKSTGQKELVDINALCEEYLRLAYHGFRAKDKTFTSKFQTDLDPSIEKIMILTQDIGRVMLNLINNAFYAVSQKKQLNHHAYEPEVSITTRKIGDKVEIRVKDNGLGIPALIKEKIFQPFFTTKPAGQGTGLGLSLAYDIVSKAHGGDLKVATIEGEGSEFIVTLPL